MNLAIASGKGGTGKTTFSVNLAYTLADKGENVRLLDCDVEEPNDHLFIRPEFTETQTVTALKPEWDKTLCNGCGKCADACHYNAIVVVKEQVLIFNELCHSCGVCAYVCPVGAMKEKPVEIGQVQAAPDNRAFYFAHGTLGIGEAMAPAVISNVKKHIDPAAVNILDASPGTSCPVVETVAGADVAVLVTEPTPFGLNDLKLAVGLTLKEKIPTGIVINRSDGVDDIIERYAKKTGIPIVGRIPFRREYAQAYASGRILTDSFPELKNNLLKIFNRITQLADMMPPDVPEEDGFNVSGAIKPSFTKTNGHNYKEVTIISGKGGSGKTTVVGALAMLTDNKVMADNDVDAADLHLLLNPEVKEAHDFVGGQKAMIDATKCMGCGECEHACHFNAIRCDGPLNERGRVTCKVDVLACEGCGLCEYVCPAGAVSSRPNITGAWYVSDTATGPMAHARLGIAEENSGKLVTRVRNVAADLARNFDKKRIFDDGPPGTGCPVIASVSGADRVLVVTEPTVSGVHDMQRVLGLARHFRIPALIVINKADLNVEQAERIEAIARENGTRVIGKIPFDPNVNEALMAEKTVIEYGRGPACEAMHQIWAALEKEL